MAHMFMYGEDLLRRCMRATFTDASTLGILMGDTNMPCDKIEDTLRYGDIGSAQNVDYHPRPQLLESCFSNIKEGRAGFTFFAHPKPLECTDFIFAGDAEVDPVKPLPRVGSLDGEHIAIAARVVFNGPPGHAISSLLPGESSGASTPGCHHGVAQRDIDAAKKLLERKTEEDMWVPDAWTNLTKAVRSGRAVWAIEEFERRHGMPPHPYTLMKMLDDSQSPWQMKKLNDSQSP